MKNLKKLVSVVLTLALLISTMATSVIAVSYADVETTDANFEAIDILSGLNILKGDEVGNFNPDAEIKRSEVAAVIARALGQEGAALGTTGYSSFADVSADHWAVGYINWAAQQGIVNGRDAQTFDPDAPVKYQEVTKMLVEALGYGPLAAKRGGYPTGHMVIASSNSITSGVSLAGDANAPRKIVAQLVYNALDVPLMDASIITASGDDEYAIYNGKGDNERRTILSYYLEIAKVEAQVVATTKGATDGKAIEIDREDEEEVKIRIDSLVNYDKLDDTYYDGDYDAGTEKNPNYVQAYCGNTSADDLLGYYVIAYVGKDDNDDDRIYAITPNTKKTEILDVKDWVDVVKAGDPYEVEYYVDGDTSADAEEIEVKASATVIINGTNAGKFADQDADLLTKQASNVVFMGDKNEDEFGYVFVTVYNYDQVIEVDAENETIDTEEGSIDLSDEDLRYTIVLDGEEIGLADLQENDVLNIVYSDIDGTDPTFVEIYVSRDVVEGVVTEYSSDDEEYVIDGTAYKMVDGESLSLGDEGTFYLTIDGKIYNMIVTAASKDYAFVTRIDEAEEFQTKTYYVEMMTADGILADYTVASSLKVTVFEKDENNNIVKKNTTYKRSGSGPLQEAIFGDDGKLGKAVEGVDAASIKARLVAYTLNSNSEISAITFAWDGKASSASVFDTVYDSTGDFAPSTGKLAGYYYGDDTVIFNAPIKNGAIDKDDVEIINVSSLDEEEDYNVFLFNTDNSKNFKAAVITDEVAGNGIEAALAVVTGTTTGTNLAGEEADGYTIVQSGEVKSIYEGENFDGDTLAKGDVFYYSVDGAGDMKNAKLVYDADGDAGKGKLASSIDNKTKEIGFVLGLALEVKGSYITLGTDLDAEGVDYSFANNDDATYARIETAKKNTKSYVTALTSKAGLKESSARKMYVTLLKINEDEEITDAIQIFTELDKNEVFKAPAYDLVWDSWNVDEEATTTATDAADDSAADDSAADDSAADDSAADDSAADDSAADDSAADDSAADDSAADDSAADDSAADDSAADDSAADDSAADDSAADDSAADDSAADDSAADDSATE